MTWLNATGNPVATKPLTFQIDIPAEQAMTVGTPNWWAVMMAVVQLASALKSADPAMIAAAIQALFAAIMGS